MSGFALFSILVGFVFSALFSGMETGSYTINRIRLRCRERERHRAAVRLSELLRNPHAFIFTVLIGNNIALYFLSKTVTDLYLQQGLEQGVILLGFIPWNAEMAATLTLIFPLFIFAEVAPKNWFRKNPDTLMYPLAGAMRLLVLICSPFTMVLKKLFSLLTRGQVEEWGSERHRISFEGLKDYFSEGAKEGLLSSQQSRMMDNATSMHRVRVRTLMTPLRAIPRLSSTASVADFRHLCARHKTTYALLIQPGKEARMVSILTVVNRNLAVDQLLEPYAEELLQLSETRNIKSAFYRLRRNPRHSAVVLDSRKHPVGFIQLEDIARYIAGA